MKKIFALMLALLMVIGVVAGCSTPAADAPADTTAPAEPTGDVAMQYMTADEAAAVLGTDGYLFLDVRKAADYEISHIPGAVSADMDAAKNGDAEAGKATMTAATEGVDDTIILVCYSGKAYAQASTNALSAIGYDMSKVYTLEGGFKNWAEAKADLVEAGSAPADDEDGAKVLSVDELEKMIAQGNVKVFDLRDAEAFAAGHIPGAMNISNKQFENPDNPVDGEIATVEQFEALMSSYGVTSDDIIVAYTKAAKPQMAPRLIWTLEVYGHTNTYLLNGNYEAWEAAGKAIETGANPEFTPAEYKVKATDDGRINVDKNYVINLPENAVLLDVRPHDQYVGKDVADGNARGGHVPGAVNVLYTDTIDENGFFHDKATLAAMYEAVGATPDKEIIVFCQRAHRASHTWFVLTHILGYKNVKVYDGSMMEWSNLLDQPISTNDENPRTADPNKTEIIMGGTQSFLNYLSFLPEKMAEWGYTVTFQAFDDVVTPDIALAEGSIDANFYQHKPYLEQYNKANGTNLYACEPALIASYESVVSKKYTSLDQLPDGAKIAIADDSSNMSFDLHSLAHLGLIELAEIPEGSYYTTFDIVSNPHNFEIIPMPMMQRYTALDDVDAACMFYSARAAEMYEFNILTIITDDPDIMFPIIIAIDGAHKDEQWVKDMMDAIAGDELRAVMDELNNPNLTWNILF